METMHKCLCDTCVFACSKVKDGRGWWANACALMPCIWKIRRGFGFSHATICFVSLWLRRLLLLAPSARRKSAIATPQNGNIYRYSHIYVWICIRFELTVRLRSRNGSRKAGAVRNMYGGKRPWANGTRRMCSDSQQISASDGANPSAL